MQSIHHPVPKSTPRTCINVARGNLIIHINSERFSEIYKDGIDPHLPFRNGDNWWSIEPATGPTTLLRTYGAKLLIDFLEFNTLCPGQGNLARILTSMPKEKGPIEYGFLEHLERLAGDHVGGVH